MPDLTKKKIILSDGIILDTPPFSLASPKGVRKKDLKLEC